MCLGEENISSSMPERGEPKITCAWEMRTLYDLYLREENLISPVPERGEPWISCAKGIVDKETNETATCNSFLDIYLNFFQQWSYSMTKDTCTILLL